ncbi:MotA/TolQ/ExbB proton channel family protein [Pontibacterium granulatum]|uniref:MotA/TolQ/ExbB proton channel family protein n=1 Tax=Pontibacterium granulatum TaxID=2036029 RepID=UPI00249A566A|nr:MotA/TolQ/ExbB proton channel family protein [Pontibacterium granulatum]MDI3324533.1 MotA/TolQ/ExbB proton channel family protein [Pontibacterium granulatum]
MLPELPGLHDWLFALGQFFHTGGWVLYPILVVSFLMFALILERVIYCVVVYPRQKTYTVSVLVSATLAVKKRSQLCDLDLALKSQFALIKTLITLCPLIGLLGTVTGMIQVFDSLALYGTGNPRLMAAGVASATFPTMSGMAVAVAGLLFHNRLSRWSEVERQKLHLVLNENQGVR